MVKSNQGERNLYNNNQEPRTQRHRTYTFPLRDILSLFLFLDLSLFVHNSHSTHPGPPLMARLAAAGVFRRLCAVCVCV